MGLLQVIYVLRRQVKAVSLSLLELAKYIENTPSKYMSLRDLENIGDLFSRTGHQIKSDIPKLVSMEKSE